MSVRPDFHDRFVCRAADCRHSCCRGWEIDVDEASAAYYGSMPGELGEKLRRSLRRDEEGAHFALTEDERCPFLQADGLCELICVSGEDALCDICALHPRFYEDVGDTELCGLGLSCEAVCALLLASEEPLRFFDDESGELLNMEELLRSLGLDCDPARLRYDGAKPSDAFLARLTETEAIDEAWPAELAALRDALPKLPAPLPAGPRYDRILQMLLYRQLERAEAVGLDMLLAYARESTAVVAACDALRGFDAEHLRRWSEQIEYSTENVGILLKGRN
jgi:lysine-N-methylase